MRAAEAEGLSLDLVTEAAPGRVDYIVHLPDGPITDFRPFTRLKAVLSLWAGVEKIAREPTLTSPLCRMVDPGLTQGMVEWVTAHVLRYHLGIDAYLAGQDGIWRGGAPPLAGDRRVAVLGVGALGRAVAEALRGLGFDLRGWGRRARDIPGIRVHSGPEGLAEALWEAEIVVLLLPATPETRNLLDARSLALLPRGARIINPGRGSLIDDAALLDALDSGQVGHATLDVFRTEPLPASHPYWAHPRVTVTPHVAARTRPVTASRTIARNIRRGEDGVPFLHVVDREAGY